MEYSLQCHVDLYVSAEMVTILVLVEYSLQLGEIDEIIIGEVVTILVLVEYSLQ